MPGGNETTRETQGHAITRLISLLEPAVATRLQNRIYLFDSMASSNDYLSDQRQPALCIAWHQTRGRGRRGKIWHSPKGSVALSLAWPFGSYARMQGISLAAGVALADCIAPLGVIPQLKWPNDLLIDDKKLGGILVESHAAAGSLIAVIGIGINLLQHPPHGENALETTFLQKTLQATSMPHRIDFCASLTNHLFAQIAILDNLGIAPVIESWRKYACWVGREVSASGRIGVYQGIDEQGHLLLATADGLQSVAEGGVRLA